MPICSHNFSGYDSHLILEKLINVATEETIQIKGEDIIAKSSENYIPVEMGCSNFLGSTSFLEES